MATFEPSVFRPHAMSAAEPITHTQSPSVSGGSILALKYRDGVMVAADRMLAYGSFRKYKGFSRTAKVGNFTSITASGDYADFQKITSLLDELRVSDDIYEDGISMDPSEYHQYLGRVLYNRRNKMDPLWNFVVVAGYKNGKSFLGSVDLVGTTYEDKIMASGYGTYIAVPLLRREYREDLTEDEAQSLLLKCMRVLYLRSTTAFDEVELTKVDATGVHISDPIRIKGEWNFEGFKNTAYRGNETEWARN